MFNQIKNKNLKQSSKKYLPTTRNGITPTISLYGTDNNVSKPIDEPIPIAALTTPKTERIGLERTQSIYHVPSQNAILHITQKTTRIKNARIKRGIRESAFRFNSSANVCE